MTREDLSFLIEKAAGLWLIVIGLGWVPELLEKWFAGNSDDSRIRHVTWEVVVPLVAGAFLLLRHARSGGAAVPVASAPASSSMSRNDWLWVGCKVTGAVSMLYGSSSSIQGVTWSFQGATFARWGPDDAIAVGLVLTGSVWLVAGAFLFFGDRLWRLACRQVPASARPAG